MQNEFLWTLISQIYFLPVRGKDEIFCVKQNENDLN